MWTVITSRGRSLRINLGDLDPSKPTFESLSSGTGPLKERGKIASDTGVRPDLGKGRDGNQEWD